MQCHCAAISVAMRSAASIWMPAPSKVRVRVSRSVIRDIGRFALRGGFAAPPRSTPSQEAASVPRPSAAHRKTRDDRTTIAFAGLVEREFGGFTPPRDLRAEPGSRPPVVMPFDAAKALTSQPPILARRTCIAAQWQ